MCYESNEHVRMVEDILAYDAPSGFAVAGFNLQGTGDSLPHVRQTLPDVQNGNVHERHLDGPIGPQLDVVHGALIWLDITASEQLRWPADRESYRYRWNNDDVALTNKPGMSALPASLWELVCPWLTGGLFSYSAAPGNGFDVGLVGLVSSESAAWWFKVLGVVPSFRLHVMGGCFVYGTRTCVTLDA